MKYQLGPLEANLIFTLERQGRSYFTVMAEKLRALMERGYARDYYDVWSHIDRIKDQDVLRDLARRKCAMANVEYAPGTIFEDGILRLVETS